MFGLFNKRQRVEPTAAEAESDAALEKQMKTAMFIQQKTQIGTMFANRLSDPREDFQAQLKHYEGIRDDLLAKLDTIEDDFCRYFASHQLIKMCMAGNDKAVARALLAGIRDSDIRVYVFTDFPELRP